MLLSRLAAEILALEFASGSASALVLLRPPFFDVALALMGPGTEAHELRQVLATVALVCGAAALLLLTYAVGGRN